jgi:hypothetical protein
MLKSSNFLTITGKMILTRRDFDLKSSEIHQEIGKSKAKAMVDELGLAEGIQTQKVRFYEKSSHVLTTTGTSTGTGRIRSNQK